MAAFAKNFMVKEGEWQPLSDIMGTDYETTLNYAIHINDIPEGNLLGFTHRETTPPSINDRGREYPSFRTIYVTKDTGDDIYLRGTNGAINVEIRQIDTIPTLTDIG